jgi:hypothetical protein
MLIPGIWKKSRKNYLHRVAGTIQMIKLILSFSAYIKILYRVEMSTNIILPG